MRRQTSLVLVVLGLLAMLVGAVDPLEGSFVILPGSGAVALGSLLGKSRYHRLLTCTFVLIFAGVAAMVVLSVLGGIGGNSGRSLWWGLFVLPYFLGWVVGLVAGILGLIELVRRPSPSASEAS